MSGIKKGYVYILSNPSMPGIVKIGRSIHGGQGRADQLYRNDTGVATPFVLEFEVETEDCHWLESHMHMFYGDCRVSPNREFFRCSVEDASNAMSAADSAANSIRSSIQREVETLKRSNDGLLHSFYRLGKIRDNLQGQLEDAMRGSSRIADADGFSEIEFSGVKISSRHTAVLSSLCAIELDGNCERPSDHQEYFFLDLAAISRSTGLTVRQIDEIIDDLSGLRLIFVGGDIDGRSVVTIHRSSMQWAECGIMNRSESEVLS